MPHAHLLQPVRFYPVALAAILFEIGWYVWVARRAYPWKEMAASLSIFAMRIPLKALHGLVVLPVALLAWSHRVADVPIGTWWGIGLLFLGEEFAYYWSHRLGHEIRWMWASHVVHHSPRQIHFASAARLGLTEMLSGGWLIHVPLYFFFPPTAVAAMFALNLFYQFWLHTEIVGRLGPLEWVLNTPAHHRVHHARNAPYLDRNYGGIVIVWDRLFGTFAEARADTPIEYGLVHPLEGLNPFKIAFQEWLAIARDFARAVSWRERAQRLFGRPGRSPALAGAQIS